jgi:glutamate racemase
MNEGAQATGPIGVFDSGVGGLSILQEIRRQLPVENLLFYADSGFCPYGTKPPEAVRIRTFAIADLLLARGAKALVVACNTATAAALEPLRERISRADTPVRPVTPHPRADTSVRQAGADRSVRPTIDVPVVGVEPAMKPAAAATRTGCVGVLATPGTLQGERYHSLLDRFGEGLTVYSEACPEFVPLVEAGQVEGPEVEAAVRAHVAPLLAQGVDTIVLGCTHYPFLRAAVERVCGPEVTVIDTAAAVARQTRRVLEERGLLRHSAMPGRVQFLTSGDADAVGAVIRCLWGDPQAVATYVPV